MASLKERVTSTIATVRERVPFVDHLLRMLGWYGSVNGNAQAGAITYFGFLSFFPILALSFYVIGLLAGIYPGIRTEMVQEIGKLLPGVIGSGQNEIPLKTIEDSAAAVGLVGLVAVLYSGLGWLSGLRSALEVVFAVAKKDKPNFVFGKLRDLAALALIGVILLVSVVLSGAVTGFSGQILDLVGIDTGATLPTLALNVVGRLLAVGASVLLLMAMFTLLASESHVPRKALLSGALLGAVAFEVLKAAAGLLLGTTKGQPAFQAFGVALILVVWINYFSRFVMYAAAWAYTAPAALARRTEEALIAPGAALAERSGDLPGPVLAGSSPAGGPAPGRSFLLAAGAALGAAVTAVVVRGNRP